MIRAMKSKLENISRKDLFQKVGEICSAVSTVLTAKELLEESLQKTMDLFGASRGSIYILKENKKDLVMEIAQGMKGIEKEMLVKRLGEGIVGRVAKSKQPIFVDDIKTDKRFSKYKTRGAYKTPSFICAPLIIKDQLIGVINISDKESGHRFNKDEMQLLDFLASQIALNYRRVELYNKFKSILKEKETLENKLGLTGQEAQELKKKIVIQEKLATIGKLAGGIAHEFNNPLDGVMRYTNLCLEHVKDNEVVRGYLLEVKHGLKRMANIVKNLLACSRNEFPHRNNVQFEEALEHCLLNLQTELAIKNIHVKKQIRGALLPIRDLGIEHVLTNLIRNAIDAMEDGGTLSLTAKSENGQLVFDIKDTGRGIPKDKFKQIFEPFYTTKEIDKGCGLGLTIVGEIIKSYDGAVDLTSTLSKGTTFTIALPYEGKRHD